MAKKQISKKKKSILKINPKGFFANLGKKIKNLSEKAKNFKMTPLRRLSITVLLFSILIYLLRSVIFAAFVDGKPIFRLNVLLTTEKQSGSTVLENLIEKRLIFSEANKENIKVGKDIVDSEIENIEKILEEQNMTLDQALLLSGQDLKSLEEQIKIQKIVEQILGSQIEVTEDEIFEYFTTNKDYFEVSTKLEDVKDQIKEQIYSQKLSTEYSTWINELKENSDIKYIVNY